MATKNNPGKFDCYAAAHPNEPIFILRANDELAASIVRIWAMIRDDASPSAIRDRVEVARGIIRNKPQMNPEKFDEAMKCASDMDKWVVDHAKT